MKKIKALYIMELPTDILKWLLYTASQHQLVVIEDLIARELKNPRRRTRRKFSSHLDVITRATDPNTDPNE